MKKPTPPVSLHQVLTKYWELANLDPETTKGSITGQLKALDALCQELAIPAGDKGAMAPRTVNIFRPEWLREGRSTASSYDTGEAGEDHDG